VAPASSPVNEAETMTFLGKTLIFLNLIFGIGAAVVGTTVYTQRPGWFADTKEGGVDKGHSPQNFAQLAADIDSQGKAANLANVNWSANYKALTAAEATRDTRYERMFGTKLDGVTKVGKGLLDYAREGNPKGASFLNLNEDPVTRLLDLNPAEDAKSIVRGPDDKPLSGTDTLLDQFVKDAAEAEVQALLSKKLRAVQKTLGDEIGVVQNQIYKQRDIRDNLVVEAARLDAFEVNATEHMQTVTRRRNQLIARLSPFRAFEKK
jgi:hypothetical protein